MGIRGIMDTKRSSQLDNSSAKRPEGAGPGGRLAWPPEEGGRNRLVERLKREEPEALALVLEHFKSGDKEAAELLVRTFYPYAERLVIALEKRDSQNKAQPQGGIAPALTSLGSKRSEFLNDFFAQLVSQAGELDLSQGIKLYIYERCLESYAERSKQLPAPLKLAEGGESKPEPKVKKAAKAGTGGDLFFDDELAEEGESGELVIAPSKGDDLFLDDSSRSPKKKISGIPASRALPGGGEPSLSGEFEGINSKLEEIAFPSSLHRAIKAQVPPAAEAASGPEEGGEPQAPMSKRARLLWQGLERLAQTDTEAYWAVALRYFAYSTFTDLSRNLGLKSSREVGLRLLEGLLKLGREQSRG